MARPDVYPPMRAFSPGGMLPLPVSYVGLNFYDKLLVQDYLGMDHIRRAGGLIGLCCPASQSGDNPPWVIMPPGGRRFQTINNINVATATEDVEIEVASFRVPSGYDGVLVSHFNICQTQMQLSEASGDVTWRIRINRRYVPDYGNINTTLGSLQGPATLYRGGVRLYSQQTVSYMARLAVGAKMALGTGRIICGLFGWWYPQT